MRTWDRNGLMSKRALSQTLQVFSEFKKNWFKTPSGLTFKMSTFFNR